MKNNFKKISLLTSVLATGILLSPINNDLLIHRQNIVNAETKENNTFENAKAKGEETIFPLEIDGFPANIKFYTINLGKNSLTKKTEYAIYGELQTPHTRQDIDVEENSEENNMKIVLDYTRSLNFKWYPGQNVNSEYDRTIFYVEEPFVLGEKDIEKLNNEVDVTINGISGKVKLQKSSNVLNIKDLEDAVSEHERDLNSAISSGLEIKATTRVNYDTKKDEAVKLITEAKKEGTTVTQEDLNTMRTELNKAFAEITPEPFDRTELQDLIKVADEKLDNNGKNNTRFTKQTYDDLMREYAQAYKLINYKDLDGILKKLDGAPLETHKSFKDSAKNFKIVIENLQTENYTKLDTTNLENAYNKAIERTPSENKGFEKSSYLDFTDVLNDIEDFLSNNIYAEQSDLDQKIQKLNEALNNLREIDLDENAKFNLKIKYTKATENSKTELIKEYFKDNNKDLETVVENVYVGQEIRIYVDDTKLIKEFDGYMPTTFHYASDDTSLHFVNVRKDKNNKKYIAFLLQNKNSNLIIHYEKREKHNDKSIVLPNLINIIFERDYKEVELVNSWKNIDGNWKYQNSNKENIFVNSWANIENNLYRFDNEGNLIQNKWVYVDGAWYWANASGKISQDEWIYVDGAWYWANESGKISQNEWIYVDGVWYWANASGKILQNEWAYINSKWYHFNSSGALSVNTVVDGYRVNSNGEWVK